MSILNQTMITAAPDNLFMCFITIQMSLLRIASFSSQFPSAVTPESEIKMKVPRLYRVNLTIEALKSILTVLF